MDIRDIALQKQTGKFDCFPACLKNALSCLLRPGNIPASVANKIESLASKDACFEDEQWEGLARDWEKSKKVSYLKNNKNPNYRIANEPWVEDLLRRNILLEFIKNISKDQMVLKDNELLLLDTTITGKISHEIIVSRVNNNWIYGFDPRNDTDQLFENNHYCYKLVDKGENISINLDCFFKGNGVYQARIVTCGAIKMSKT